MDLGTLFSQFRCAEVTEMTDDVHAEWESFSSISRVSRIFSLESYGV